MSLRRLLRPSWRALGSAASSPASRRLKSHKTASAPFPTIPSCPSPSCSCAPMPSFPDGLEIDHSKRLDGTMASYAEQLLVCTGQTDWVSRIEEENGGENLVADVKELVGRGGIYADPYHNTPLTNSSFLPTPLPPSLHSPLLPPSTPTTSAYLLPSFLYLPLIPRTSTALEALVKGYLQPPNLHPSHSALSPIHRDRLRRSLPYRALLPPAQEVRDIVLLICAHGGRDARCGILGPVLAEEFRRALPRAGVKVLDGAVPLAADPPEDISAKPDDMTARIALISHIGGHKFAGNVILYIPPSARLPGGQDGDGKGEPHPLRGMGIWYGRVEPRHVQGIVEATLVGGKVVEELFRGGVERERGVLHLPLRA